MADEWRLPKVGVRGVRITDALYLKVKVGLVLSKLVRNNPLPAYLALLAGLSP